ncbi:hypothetical protein BaRGS_00014980, partial [Batillaria attramentaria]
GHSKTLKRPPGVGGSGTLEHTPGGRFQANAALSALNVSLVLELTRDAASQRMAM